MKLKLFIAVRHGEYELGSDESPLSEEGRKHMQSLRRTIDVLVTKTFFRGWIPRRLYFSFSEFPRAIQSVRLLKYVGERTVVLDLYDGAGRKEITRPMETLEEMMKLSSHYGAEVIVAVAHRTMPTVIAGVAHQFVTGKRLDDKLPYVRAACGFAVDMVTGQVVSIGWDDHVPAESPPATQESNRPVLKGPPRSDKVILKDILESGEMPF